MSKRLIKICGIKDPHLAMNTVKAGAKYIGIVFHKASPRYVELKTAIRIAEATHLAGGIPVAVFVNQSAKEMHSICEATNIKTVQLHGDSARNDHPLLPSSYERIYVQKNEHSDDHLHDLNPLRDFILIESGNHISLKNVATEMLRNTKGLHFRWFLAGGLTPNNVQTAINMLEPNGIDVSSGVESTIGNKDIGLIQKFIGKVESCNAS